MSYDLFYNKQFIKVDDKRVIPFVLIGCNNLYEGLNNNKRVREWTNIFTYNEGKNIIVDKNTLIANIDKYREQTIQSCADSVKEYNDDSWAYDDKRWGYHTSVAMYGKRPNTTTFSMYKSFFKNGIKEAMTVEELYDADVRLSLRVSPYYDKAEFETLKLSVLPTIYIKTTQELIDKIAEYEAYYAGVKSATLYISESGMDRHIYKKRRNKLENILTKRAQKKQITVSEYYVLKHIANGSFFIKNIKYGYKYSYNAISGKAFHSEAKANAFHKRMRNKDLFAVTKILENRSFSI